MKRVITKIALVCLFVVGFMFLQMSDKAEINKETALTPMQKKVEASLMGAEYVAGIRANATTGKVEMQDMIEARREVEAHRKANAGVERAGFLPWEELGPDNVGGRTRAFLIDSEDPNKLFAGSVAGGLWTSDNFGANWYPVSNTFDNGMIAVSSITQSANGDIYVGTGEGYYFFNGQGVAGIVGNGIYKSSNRGESFDLLETTWPYSSQNTWQNDAFASVDQIAAHPTNSDIVYAACGADEGLTNKGVYVTLDGGASWNVIQDTNGSPINAGTPWEVDVKANGVVHAIIGGRYFRSINDTQFEELEIPSLGSGRKVLAISEADNNYLFVGSVTGQGGCMNNVVHSNDGGESWTVIGIGTPAFEPFSNSVQCQGDYDNIIAADPQRTNVVYIAGITLWRGINVGTSWSWEQIDNASDDSPSNTNYVHADKHNIVFAGSSDKMFILGDGGVGYTSNATEDFPTFVVKNKGYNVTQFYKLDAGIDGKIMGGTQDNGSQYVQFNFNGTKSAVEVNGGDGGFAEISNINPNALFVGNPNGDLYRSSNNGDGFGQYLDCNIDCTGGGGEGCSGDGTIDAGASFVTPFILWEDDLLFYAVKDIQLPVRDSDDDPFSFDIVTLPHLNQSFFATNDPSQLQNHEDQYDNPYEEDQITLKVDDETGKVIDYGPNDYRYKRSRMFVGDTGGTLWMTEDALNFSTTPFWLRIGDTSGEIGSIEVSDDGNTVWAGTSSGNIIRVTNIDEIPIKDIKEDNDDACNNIATYFDNASVFTGSSTGVGSRYVSGFAINEFNQNEIYVSYGNYGSSNYVYKVSGALTNSPSFESVQSNLPKMPVYDIITLSSIVFVGTEYGVWKYDANSGAWEEENDGDLHSVPVFSLRKERIDTGNEIDFDTYKNCFAVYAGTHGRGAFRAIPITSIGCNTDLPGFNPTINTSVEDLLVEALTIAPNPARGNTRITVKNGVSIDIAMSIYNMNGQSVREVYNGNLSGGATSFDVNVSDLPAGNYILNATIGNKTARNLSRMITVVR